MNGNVPLGQTEATGGLVITRNSLASTGQKLVRATFRFLNDTTTYTGLFRGTRGVDEMLISTKEAPAGVALPFTVDGDFGIACGDVASPTRAASAATAGTAARSTVCPG